MATTFNHPESEPRAARPVIADDDAGLPAKPIVRPPSRAKSTARQRLAEGLIERYSHDEASATAIA